LIVDDNEAALVQIRNILAEEGYELSFAKDGAAALQIIEADIPDGIVLDLMMPEVDGFAVLEKVRSIDKSSHIPVMILSARHITKEELRTLRRNNIHQLIQKGNINRRELQEAVASMFRPHGTGGGTACREEQEDRAVKPVVLVVEDNPDNRLTVRVLLKDDFTVIEATDGEMAVELASAKLPDLILMDISLPGMDGVTAFKTIRRNPKLSGIPVIALTASAMTTDREIFLAHGFDAFIPKPIIETQCLQVIRRILYHG
jgi:CheY-like chemotaxis protein